MTLLDSLLDAIVRLDGDALVMHVGEKPYVVTTSSAMNAYRGPLAWGQVELSSRVLTPDAVLSMVGQILPDEQRHALDEVGAVEHEIEGPQGLRDRFSVVAARGGDDIWLELRRLPVPAAAAVGEASPIESDKSPALEAAPAAEKASDRSVSTAVGLQEPPQEEPGAERRAGHDDAQEAAPQPRTTAPAEDARTPETQEGEAGGEAAAGTEDVESYLIPLPGPEPEERERPDAPMELVEAEAQHAPTDEDVDAMLAATAASLLGASRKPEAESPAGADAAEDGIFLADTFEIVIEEEEAHEDEAEAEDLDLTTELAAMPPPAFPSAEAAPPQAVDVEESRPESAEPASAPEAAPPGGTPHDEPAVPTGSAAAPEPGPVKHDEPEPRREDHEPEIPAAANAEDESPRVEAPAHEEPSGEAVPGPEETAVDIITAQPGRGASAPEPTAAPSLAARAPAASPSAPPAAAPPAPEERRAPGEADDRLLHILKVAAERGASTIYAVAQSTPMLRVDGEIAPLENEPALTAENIERLVAALSPGDAGAPNRDGDEWMTAIAGIGRVRCVAFRDHRGPGLILRLISAKSISAEHLNLSAEIRELCTLADGLVLVAGARGSGRSTLLNSFVDLINRTRSEHVVTIESDIAYVHESGRSFVSQRQARGEAAAAAVRAALREDADVLVVEDVQSPEEAMAVLDAAESGRLVFASITAGSSTAAIETLLNLVPEGERAGARAVLAGVLRGVVTQALVKKASGGRVAARELLLNSPAVAAAVRNNDMPGVAAALDGGGRHGMVPLTEALAALVRGGAVHAAEACRRAPDRQGILAALAREGVDTSFAERLA